MAFLNTIKDWIMAHGIVAIVIAINIVLTAVSQAIVAMKGVVPAWFGTILDVLKKIIDFMSANPAHTDDQK